MDIKNLEKFDTNHMFRTYDKWPEIAETSFENEYEKIDISEIDHVVFAGMGGSGSIGDTISGILSKNDTISRSSRSRVEKRIFKKDSDLKMTILNSNT